MEKSKNITYLSAILTGLYLFTGFYYAGQSSYNQAGVILGLNFNLAFYVFLASSAFLLFLLLTLIPDHLLKKEKSDRVPEALSKVLMILYTICIFGLLFYLWTLYTEELNVYPGDIMRTYFRHLVPHKIYFSLGCALAIVLLFVAVKWNASSSVVRLLAAAAVTTVNCVMLYAPNPFADQGAGIYHIHAYTNSILNVSRGIPFDSYNASIYGHYGIFYFPIVRLFGGRYTGVLIGILIAAALTMLAMCFAAHSMIRSDVVYLLTCIGMLGTTLIFNRRGQYYQLNPHRLLFPAVAIAFVAFFEFRVKKWKERILQLLAGVLCVCAIIWNLETGLFTAAVIAAWQILHALRGHRFFSLHVWKRIVLEVLYVILYVFFSWFFVGLYNLACGGTFNGVRTFIFPLFSGNLGVSNVQIPLPRGTAVYVFEVILFILTIFMSLRNIYQVDRDMEITTAEKKSYVLFVAGVSGALSIIYFLNRSAVSNMSIAHLQTVFLLGVLADQAPGLIRSRIRERRFFQCPSEWLETGICGMLFLAVTFTAVEGLGNFPQGIAMRRGASWDTDSYREVLSSMRKEIPADTLGFGIGVPELYAELGWDTQVHIIDISDMNDGNRAFLESVIDQSDAFVTSETDVLANTFIPDDFVCVRKWEINTVSIEYFRRKV